MLNMKTSHRFINIPRALSICRPTTLHNIPSYTKHTTHTVQMQPGLGKTGCLIIAQCRVMDRPIQNDTNFVTVVCRIIITRRLCKYAVFLSLVTSQVIQNEITWYKTLSLPFLSPLLSLSLSLSLSISLSLSLRLSVEETTDT